LFTVLLKFFVLSLRNHRSDIVSNHHQKRIMKYSILVTLKKVVLVLREGSTAKDHNGSVRDLGDKISYFSGLAREKGYIEREIIFDFLP
jgi:hypothetical protein